MSTQIKEPIEVKNVVLMKNKTQKADSNLLALCSVNLLDGAFRVNGIRVIQGEKGTFVSMPGRKKFKAGAEVISEKTGKPEYDDIFHALTADARNVLNAAVMNAYNAVQATANATATAAEAAHKA
ncbi:MAG TPA: septation protein SpoVG family protein [Patescibacteria group bacterium]|nr:septation protein SpoVG family protein [Patescibacteria group bacterium]